MNLLWTPHNLESLCALRAQIHTCGVRRPPHLCPRWQSALHAPLQGYTCTFLGSPRPNIGGHRNWFCRKAMLPFGPHQAPLAHKNPFLVLWCFVLNPHQPHAHLETKGDGNEVRMSCVARSKGADHFVPTPPPPVPLLLPPGRLAPRLTAALLPSPPLHASTKVKSCLSHCF